MRILYQLLDGPRECTYLPVQQALLQYRLVSGLDPAEYEKLMIQGFRKFSQLLFRPVCHDCQACQPLRVLVSSFKPDRSMRRNLLANEDLKIEIRPAQNSTEVIELYNQYHEVQAKNRKWPYLQSDPADYSGHFLKGDILIEEIAVYHDNKLLALMLFEELEKGLSLIYHFYDTELPHRGLGTYLILKTIDVAAKRNKDFAYLGYYVFGSKSMEYKSKFKPHQILVNGQWL